jgi:hypothetical protein
MIVAIHQPNFVPWLGYFYKIASSDVFVLLDDVQFTKNGFTNRNRIKTAQGEHWLTLPVVQSGQFGQLISDCKIQQKELSCKKMINTLRMNYAKSGYAKMLLPEFEKTLSESSESLLETNISIIKWVCEKLHITTPIITSSSLAIEGKESTERLIAICKKLNATTYISGKGGFKYQDEDLFKANHIQLQTSSFSPPVYQQLWGEFIPGLSVLDTLFCVGEETKKYISI